VPDSPSAGPFACILVPYDGSEPARSALALALAILPPSGRLVVMTAVDEMAVISESATVTAYDPTPLFEALDAQAKAVLADAGQRCAAVKITPIVELVRDAPVSAVVDTMKKHGVDLVVMGTHARTGAARLFLGSTTEAVLRSSTAPVLTVRATQPLERHPFAIALLGVDDSEASDAAVALAAKLAGAFKTQIIACNAIDATQLYENAASYPFDPQELLEEMHAEGEAIVARALKRASFDAAAATVEVVDGSAATALLESAQQHNATVIVLGSHGRRGLRRFFLGSVAEDIVRGSTVPVLVVREASVHG
jgi:nucleotide-binding universal stress UspA family protein